MTRTGSLLFFLFMLFAVTAHSQSEQAAADSLYRAYLKETTDTGKVNLLVELATAYEPISPVKGLGFAREALELSMRMNYYKGICWSNQQIAGYYDDQLNYSESIKRYLLAAQAAEKEGMHKELSRIYNGMGIIYSNQEKYDLSLKYFLKMIKIAEENKLQSRLGVGYNNLGITYKELGRYSDANKYYQKALAEFEKKDFVKGIASVSNNLGSVYHLLGDDKRALEYYEKALKTFQSINDTVSESGIFTNIGELYNDQKQYKKALEYYLKGMSRAEQFHHKTFTNDAYEGLSKVYANLGSYDLAYKYLNKHLALKDSLQDEEGMRQVNEMERRMENEKQEKEIQILQQRQEIQALKVKSQSQELKRSNLIILSVAGILLIVLLMSFFIYKAYKQIKKTNSELGEKKKEIQDSINYARNIQQAMLPDVGVLARHFPEGFGLYLPKDVVSGDFYWFAGLDDMVYLAVVDCTGHGVPGAFMSMIGIDKLNQGLLDKKIESPAAILSFLNVSVKKALKQHSDASASKDGMDMALCSYNDKTLQLRYSGANRPLWILRKKEIIEYKSTKASIAGYTDVAQEYAETAVQLEKGDAIYLFTDGFADQFGGPDKKKFMTRQLKQVLIQIADHPMAEQEIRLQKIFNDWKGNLEQVDDVLVLGFRV